MSSCLLLSPTKLFVHELLLYSIFIRIFYCSEISWFLNLCVFQFMWFLQSYTVRLRMTMRRRKTDYKPPLRIIKFAWNCDKIVNFVDRFPPPILIFRMSWSTNGLNFSKKKLKTPLKKITLGKHKISIMLK